MTLCEEGIVQNQWFHICAAGLWSDQRGNSGYNFDYWPHGVTFPQFTEKTLATKNGKKQSYQYSGYWSAPSQSIDWCLNRFPDFYQIKTHQYTCGMILHTLQYYLWIHVLKAKCFSTLARTYWMKWSLNVLYLLKSRVQFCSRDGCCMCFEVLSLFVCLCVCLLPPLQSAYAGLERDF